MKILARLSLTAVVVAYGEVMLGSWTRINDAGMTCPDYPLCHGEIVPSMAHGTVWEWTHRLTAAVLSLIVLAVIAAGVRSRSRSRFIAPLTGIIALLFVFQIFLGAATVHLANSPISVVWHWGTAMAFIASMTAMAIFSGTASDDAGQRERKSRDLAIAGSLAGTLFLVFVTMCVGAYVSSSGAGLACLSIPGCGGHVVVYTPGQDVQMLHRFVAAATLLSAVVSFAFAWVYRVDARIRVAVTVGLAFLFIQVLLGLLNVVLRLPLDLREAHAANAALVFLSFVSAFSFALMDGMRVRRPVHA